MDKLEVHNMSKPFFLLKRHYITEIFNGILCSVEMREIEF